MIIGAVLGGAARPAACAPPPPPEDAPQAVAAAPLPEEGSEAKLRVPPVGFWGSLAYDLRGQESRSPAVGGDSRSLEQLLTTRLEGATFIWQPWFARVRAAIGLTLGWSDLGGDAPSSHDLYTTGRLQLNLFPASRFPLEAYYDVTDTRVDGGLVALPPARWTRIGVNQSYRPEGSPYSLSGRYEYATQESQSTGRDVQQTLDVNAARRWSNHDLSLTATANRSRRERSGEDLDFATLYGRHGYSPSAEYSFESNANITSNKYTVAGSGIDTRTMQYVGIGQWRPSESPLTVTGTARMLALETGASGETFSAYLSLGATYETSRNLRYTANAGLGYLTAPGVDQALYGASGGVQYTGDTIDAGAFLYDWNASASLSAAGRASDFAGGLPGGLPERREPDGSVYAVSGTLGHSIGRAFPLSGTQAVSVQLMQSLSGIKSTERSEGREEAARLTTDLSLSYNAGGAPLYGYARLSATDSRSVTGRDSTFQMVNLQVSGTWSFSRYAQLVGDVSAQWVRNQSALRIATTPGFTDEPTIRSSTAGISANIAYRHQRVFGVPRLRFLSELRVAEDTVLEQEQRLLMPDRESAYWENRLEYTIGRLLLSLSARVSEVNNSQVRLVLFRIQRDFEGLALW